MKSPVDKSCVKKEGKLFIDHVNDNIRIFGEAYINAELKEEMLASDKKFIKRVCGNNVGNQLKDSRLLASHPPTKE